MLQVMLSFVAAHPFVCLFVVLLLTPLLTGAVFVGERQVGIVVKRFGGRGLAPGQLVALRGEAGYQADTLSPGIHFGFWRWQYSVRKVPVTIIPPGEIGLVVAADGASIPPDRILGRVVACDNFQDARAFLAGRGEKGRQLDLLTAGTYRIHTVLFDVITARNAAAHGLLATCCASTACRRTASGS